jgi:hypothetical protein
MQAHLDQHPDLGAPNSIHVKTVDHVVYLDGLVSAGPRTLLPRFKPYDGLGGVLSSLESEIRSYSL